MAFLSGRALGRALLRHAGLHAPQRRRLRGARGPVAAAMVKRAAVPDPATALPVLRSAGQTPFTAASSACGSSGRRSLPVSSRRCGSGERRPRRRALRGERRQRTERRAGVTLRPCGRGSDRSRVRAVGALASALDGALPAPLGDGAASPWALHGRGAGLWRASMHLCTMVDAARVWGREGAACAHVARVASSRIPTQERGGVSTVVCRSFPVCFCLRLAADCTTESPSQSTSELCEQAL
mmetsp:Transcript_10383/g.30457  ORF Transcript_10383/g.30457 Transcript_10383/m.30457 type:complete len:240 (-) Transcript_10383:53-772(-)